MNKSICVFSDNKVIIRFDTQNHVDTVLVQIRKWAIDHNYELPNSFYYVSYGVYMNEQTFTYWFRTKKSGYSSLPIVMEKDVPTVFQKLFQLEMLLND